MDIKEALKKYNKIEIELLLAHVLKKPKEFVFLHPEYRLSADQQTKLLALIKRRQKGEPIAYILGYKDFFGLRFKVNKNVLIPRPETEMVVDLVISNVAKRNQKSVYHRGTQNRSLPLSEARGRDDTINILDIGTGSGAIIISLAHAARLMAPITDGSHLKLYASDISPAALKVAKENAKAHHAKIKFIHTDILENVRMKFDIIIANLPYGWHGVRNRFSSVKDGLRYEPQQALYTKEKGLYEIRRLLEQIALRKHQPYLIYLEFDPRQKQVLSRLIKKHLPKSKIKFYRDLNNFWRYAEIKTNTSTVG